MYNKRLVNTQYCGVAEILDQSLCVEDKLCILFGNVHKRRGEVHWEMGGNGNATQIRFSTREIAG